jgi:hypothetical protein
MFKKSWLILLLLVCMGGMSASNSYGYPARILNYGGSSSDLCVFAEWKFIANSTNSPTEAQTTVSNLVVQAHLFNPSGQDGGLGVFYPDIVLTSLELVTNGADRNGVWTSERCWTHSELSGNIDWYAYLPNTQWTVDEGTEHVVAFHVRIEGFSDLDGSGQIEEGEFGTPPNPTAWVEGDCTLSNDLHNFICETTAEGWVGKITGTNK